MKIQKIIDGVNKLVGNYSSMRLRYAELELYLDTAVDHINQFLKPSPDFKTVSEVVDLSEEENEENINYDEFPDKYIRSILIYFTASLYLEEEDETEQQYQIYRARAREYLEGWYQTDFGHYDTHDDLYPYTDIHPVKSLAPNVRRLKKELEETQEDIKDLLDEVNSDLPPRSPYWDEY